MADDVRPGAARSLAVVCGNGDLPIEVIAAARAEGRDPLVVAIRGEADPARDVFDGALWFEWGEIGRLFNGLKRNGVRDVVLIGGVTQRPDFRSILGDFGTVRRLPRILKAMRKGDDGLLTSVIALFEEEGMHVVGAHEIAPALLAGAGTVTRRGPDCEAGEDMALARDAAQTLGRLDIGQAAVAVNGRVIALEAAEGTDNMLRRCVDMKAEGRVRWKGRAGVLVKCVKPGQDLRIDLPSIGPRTVEMADAIGLAGIAVDAGGVLVANRAQTIARANEAGLFIYGLDGPSVAERSGEADDV